MQNKYDDMKSQKIKDLILDFVINFSTFEYTLKEMGFYQNIRNSSHGVSLDWDKFVNENDEKLPSRLDEIKSDSLKEALEFFLFNPPRKQIINNGDLDYSEIHRIIDVDNLDWKFILVFVRRVRNNLFHGVKSPLHPSGGRDRNFIGYSLEILLYLAEIADDFHAVFSNRYLYQMSKRK